MVANNIDHGLEKILLLLWLCCMKVAQTQPKITSLIPNPAILAIGMAAADKKMHNQISVMQIHAQNMQKIVLEKSGYAELSTEVQSRSGLEQPRQGQDMPWSRQRSWNNFLRGIFLTVLKLFQNWNIIPSLSTNGGIMVFQLFQAASTESGIFYSITGIIFQHGGAANYWVRWT